MMGDLETFKKIDVSSNPAEAKSLGRQVRNFDDSLWRKNLEEVAFEVVKQKFAAEKELTQLLLSTGDAILVEASPTDRIWGIGVAASDPRTYNPDAWPGQNILGYALMRARDSLQNEAVSCYRSLLFVACYLAVVEGQADAKEATASEAVGAACKSKKQGDAAL